MRANVYLVGPRASGKTSLGLALAARLGRDFADTDALFLQKQGPSIADFLALDPAEAQRPSLPGRPLTEEVAEVLAQRAPLYEGVAHATLDAAQAPAALLDQAVAALASVTVL
jgi:shikimate kinase